jgi:hypothetical protein
MKSPSPGTLFFAFLLAYQLIFYFAFAQIRPWLGASVVQSPWFLILLQCLTLLLPLYAWLAMKRERLQTHMANEKLGATNAVYILMISFLLLPVMSLISALSTFISPNVASDVLEQMQPHSLLLLLLAVAVTPAVLEEVVFRGYIQSQYPRWAFWKVALLNGFFFGLIHMNIQQFFYAFFMGVVMAYFVYHTRSIRAGILSHLFVNAFNIIVFRFFSWFINWAEEAEIITPGEIAAAEEASIWEAVAPLGVIALIFTPIAYILFKAFISHNRARAARESGELT